MGRFTTFSPNKNAYWHVRSSVVNRPFCIQLTCRKSKLTPDAAWRQCNREASINTNRAHLRRAGLDGLGHVLRPINAIKVSVACGGCQLSPRKCHRLLHTIVVYGNLMDVPKSKTRHSKDATCSARCSRRTQIT